MKKIISHFTTIGLIVFFLASCQKGDRGPAGPQGTNGSDSVLHSAWMSLTMTLSVDTNGDTTYIESISAPAVTAGALDSGLVISYIQNLFATDGSIVDVADYSSFLDVSYNVGVINLISFIGDLSQAQFSYVVIPGRMLGSSVFKQYTKAQIRAMDFATLNKLVTAAQSGSN